MAMTFSNYASLRDKLIYPELVDTLQTSNQTMAIWNMGVTPAPYVQVNRMLAYPTVGAVDCSTVISASDISGAAVTFNFDTFETTVPFCWDVQAGANAGDAAKMGLLKGMLRAASEKVESLIIDGGTNFNGLDDLIVAGQTFAAASTASTSDLSKALRLTKGAGQKVFVANGTTYDKIESVLKAESTLRYEQLADGTFDTISYRGVPVVINDEMTNGDVYCATLGGEGVEVLFNESGENKIGGVFDFLDLGYQVSSINRYYRLIFRATQILHNPQALTKITSFD